MYGQEKKLIWKAFLLQIKKKRDRCENNMKLEI